MRGFYRFFEKRVFRTGLALVAVIIGTGPVIQPHIASAQTTVLPIRCDQVQRDWPVVLPNGNHDMVATFYVSGPCLCGNRDPQESFNSLATKILQGTTPGQESFLFAAAEAIHDNGGFTSDGEGIHPAVQAFVGLEKNFVFRVDPADDSSAEEKVFCVSTADLAGWSNGMRPFAKNHESSFPRNQ